MENAPLNIGGYADVFTVYNVFVDDVIPNLRVIIAPKSKSTKLRLESCWSLSLTSLLCAVQMLHVNIIYMPQKCNFH